MSPRRTMPLVAIVVAVIAVLAAGIAALFLLDPFTPREQKLTDAARRGDVEAVRRLLERGADANGVPDTTPPLYWAAHAGNLELVKLLLDRGADPNRCHREKLTALSVAVHLKHEEVARLLLARGADVTIAEVHHGFTPLHLAVDEAGRASPDLIRDLAKASPAALSARDLKGRTPLVVALDWGTNEKFDPAIRALLDAGASPSDWTALTTAQPKHLGWLLDAGASPRAVSPDGSETLLHAAVRRGLADSVALLLARGADADVPNAEGKRPLELAVELGRPAAVKQLLDQGAKPELCADLVARAEQASATAAEAGPPGPGAAALSLADKLVGLAERRAAEIAQSRTVTPGKTSTEPRTSPPANEALHTWERIQKSTQRSQ